MKKLLILLIVFPLISFSQQITNDNISTSETEYNYLTKTYQSIFEKGEEVKPGYEIVNVGKDKIGDFSIAYSYFNHLESKKTKAVLIVVTKEKTSKDKVIYLCLPFNNPELLKKFSDESNSLGVSMKMAFDMSIYKALSMNIDKNKNK